MAGSGATFTVIKEDPAHNWRIYCQYKWLDRHNDCAGTVHVYEWFPERRGYSMEYLMNRPATERDVDVVAGILRRNVWSQPYPGAAVRDWSVIREHPDVYRWWLRLPALAHDDYCDTHGDPTLENLMMRLDGVPVLIDPIPDAVFDGRVPSIRALDLAKLLQSALGYEDVRRGTADAWNLDPWLAYRVRENCRDELEWQRTCCLCLLNVHRFIPYQNDVLRKRWEKWLPSIAETLLGISTEY